MNRLMIVAHPDDEVIFGAQALPGSHVICVTCAGDAVRAAEFRAVVAAAGATGELWGHRDDYNGWTERERQRLQRELSAAVDRLRPAEVVTHNAEGEYGHLQHSQLHQLVLPAKPRTFGRGLLDPASLALKRRLLVLYPSQRHVIELPLIEDWIVYGTVH